MLEHIVGWLEYRVSMWFSGKAHVWDDIQQLSPEKVLCYKTRTTQAASEQFRVSLCSHYK